MNISPFNRESSRWIPAGTWGKRLVLPLLLLPLLCTCGRALAQPDQVIPPFLQEPAPPQVVELQGRTYQVPDFSIASSFLPQGGSEFITNTPFGFLATRRTSRGVHLELRRFRDVFRAAEYFRSTPNPLLVTEGLGRTANGPVFDFAQTAPHLAFFCRLEINEDKGFVIPAKFRLGGHTYWQDNLLRRD